MITKSREYRAGRVAAPAVRWAVNVLAVVAAVALIGFIVPMVVSAVLPLAGLVVALVLGTLLSGMGSSL